MNNAAKVCHLLRQKSAKTSRQKSAQTLRNTAAKVCQNITAKVYGNSTAKVRYLAAEVICAAEVHITFGDQGLSRYKFA